MKIQALSILRQRKVRTLLFLLIVWFNVFIIYLILDVESNDNNGGIESKQKRKFSKKCKNRLAKEIPGTSCTQTVCPPRNTTKAKLQQMQTNEPVLGTSGIQTIFLPTITTEANSDNLTSKQRINFLFFLHLDR